MRARLATCDICPRRCRVNRLEGEKGFCRSGYLPAVVAVCDHHGEEPAISGSRGSGTVFFGHCNLRCLYCQNHQISQPTTRIPGMEPRALAEAMLRLQDELGCHNINFVSPSHVVPQLLMALVEAVPMGLHLPLVYNTSSYDAIDSLRALDGVIDIYLADLRYASDRCGWRFSRAPRYVSQARAAIREMYRQVGHLITDTSGLARRGLIVRHLVLPHRLAGSEESLRWLAEEVSAGVTVSIMAQYSPASRAQRVPELSRPITAAEYGEVLQLLDRFGLEDGWVQELSASDSYLPDFERQEHPFQADLGPAPAR
jgi:putative pyruvate formate lyase activating enzyme